MDKMIILDPKPAQGLEIDKVMEAMALEQNSIIANKDEVVVTLKGKAAGDYLAHIADLLEKADDKIRLKSDFLQEYILNLRFLAMFDTMAELKMSKGKPSFKEMLSMEIDTRTGFPIFEYMTLYITKFRERVISRNADYCKMFRMAILTNPEKKPALEDYSNLFNEYTKEIASKTLIPTILVIKEVSLDPSIINCDINGYNFMDFFKVEGIEIRPHWHKRDVYVKKNKEIIIDPEIRSMLENRVVNNARFLYSQIREIFAKRFGRKADDFIVNTKSIILNNELTKAQTLKTFFELPKDQIKKDCLIVRDHNFEQDGKRITENVQYIIIEG